MTGKHRAVTAMLIPLMLAACQDSRSTGPLEPDAAVFAANPNPGVLPRNSRPFGKTYEDWAVAYRQWLTAIPAASNPAIDLTGEFCGEGQSGPVWFLASHGPDPGTAVRECHVPAGKALYVPLVGFITWAPDFLGLAAFVVATFVGLDPATLTDEEIIRFAVNWVIDHTTHLSLTVNGVAYRDLFSYRAESPAFMLTETAIFDDIGTPISQPNLVVTDGFAVILPPLRRGSHTIEIRAEANNPILGEAIFDITYHLTVGPR
jgi:hypothetical protein